MVKKVSIIIPYDNDRGWLNEAIESVEAQTYPNIELILSQSYKGVSHNLNEGIKKATGAFIKYFAEDDMLTPNCIIDSIDAIEGKDFIHGKAFTLFKDGRTELFTPKYKAPELNQMIHNNVFHGLTMFYRADVFERFGYFDETLWTGEEYDFNMKIMSKGATVGYCDKVLGIYRRHDNQKSLGIKANQRLRKQAIKQIKLRYVQ